MQVDAFSALHPDIWLVIAAQNFCSERVAPIFRVSSVTGEGLDNLKTFFNLLQPRIPTGKINDPAEFTVDDVFSVPGVGTVVSGNIQKALQIRDS